MVTYSDIYNKFNTNKSTVASNIQTINQNQQQAQQVLEQNRRNLVLAMRNKNRRAIIDIQRSNQQAQEALKTIPTDLTTQQQFSTDIDTSLQQIRSYEQQGYVVSENSDGSYTFTKESSGTQQSGTPILTKTGIVYVQPSPSGADILRQQLSSGYVPKTGDVQQYPGGPIINIPPEQQPQQPKPPVVIKQNMYQQTIESIKSFISGKGTKGGIADKPAPEVLSKQELNERDLRWEKWKRLPVQDKIGVYTAMGFQINTPGDLQLIYGYATGRSERQMFDQYVYPYMKKVVGIGKEGIPAAILAAGTETIPGLYITGKGIQKTLGFVKGIGPVGQTAAGYAGRGLLGYSLYSTVEGAKEAQKSGSIGEYLVTQGVFAGMMIPGMRTLKLSEIKGIQQRILANAQTDIERSRLNTIFDAIESSRTLPSKKRIALDLNVVEKLANNPTQQERLLRFLQDPEIKKTKIVLGGSSAMYTYEQGRPPKDIDLWIKPRTSIGFEGYKPTITRESLSGEKGFIRNKMREYGMDLDIYDVHDLPKPGSTLDKLGVGYTQRPIRSAPGSPFKYQLRFSELATRKFKETLAPEKLGRGKDWLDAIKISAEHFNESKKLSPMKYAKYLQKTGQIKLEIGKGVAESRSPGAVGIYASGSKETIPFYKSLGYEKEFYKGKPTFRYIGIESDVPRTKFFAKLKQGKRNLYVYGIESPPMTRERVLTHELTHFQEERIGLGRIGGEKPRIFEPRVQEKSIKTKGFKLPTLTEQLERYKPELGPGERGKTEFKGPSYYERHPELAPKKKLTLIQKGIRRFGEPLTSEELFITNKPEPGVKQFLPKLYEGKKPITEFTTYTRNESGKIIVKGTEKIPNKTTFFSSVGATVSKDKSNVPIVFTPRIRYASPIKKYPTTTVNKYQTPIRQPTNYPITKPSPRKTTYTVTKKEPYPIIPITKRQPIIYPKSVPTRISPVVPMKLYFTKNIPEIVEEEQRQKKKKKPYKKDETKERVLPTKNRFIIQKPGYREREFYVQPIFAGLRFNTKGGRR